MNALTSFLLKKKEPKRPYWALFSFLNKRQYNWKNRKIGNKTNLLFTIMKSGRFLFFGFFICSLSPAQNSSIHKTWGKNQEFFNSFFESKKKLYKKKFGKGVKKYKE